MNSQRGRFKPVIQRTNLTTSLIAQMRKMILDGEVALGELLPTEQAMIVAFGVSRTVVREAVAALRSEGLVVSRQGLGTFVASSLDNRPFAIDAEMMNSITDVLNIMELRMTVELEAAALAAERRTKQDIKELDLAITAIDRALEAGKAAVEPDFQFHVAISKATKNPYFPQFLEFLGRLIIPRQHIGFSKTESKMMHDYLTVVQQEHRNIETAIKARDADGARAAMRVHLMRGRDRYKHLDSIDTLGSIDRHASEVA